MTVHQYGKPMSAVVGQKLILRTFGTGDDERTGFCEYGSEDTAPFVRVPVGTKFLSGKECKTEIELCGKRINPDDDHFTDALFFSEDKSYFLLSEVLLFHPLIVGSIPNQKNTEGHNYRDGGGCTRTSYIIGLSENVDAIACE